MRRRTPSPTSAYARCSAHSKPKTVRRAVALHDDPAQPQQTRAIELAGIHALLECLDDGQRDEPAKPREQISLEFLTQVSAEHLCEPFGSLQRDVADETVAHDDIGDTFVDVVALDVAMKIEPAAAQQLACLPHHFVTLDVFLADIEQADAGAFLVAERRRTAKRPSRRTAADAAAYSRRWRRGRACRCCRAWSGAPRRSPGARSRAASSGRSVRWPSARPVLPALTQACASPVLTRLIATRIDESFLRLSAVAGGSSIATTWDAA